MTVEFSRMSINRNDQQEYKQHFLIHLAVRKYYNYLYYEYPESEPTKIIEVSFPVLQGASGAPLFEFDSRMLLG